VRPDRPDDDGASILRSEEELHVGTSLHEAGRVHVRKVVGERHDTEMVERNVEQMEMETTPPVDGDTGEVITLPDGSLSVPLFEEQIVVQKRLVVRERIVLRKYNVAHTEHVNADVRVEHVEIVPDAEVRDRVEAGPDAIGLVRDAAQPGSTTLPPTPEETEGPRR
jgi:uncharacterized protein (TIGR02271 family)